MTAVLLGAAIFLIVGVIAYGATIYNGLIVVKNNIAKAWGNIDVMLKQRHDEIPKLIKVCEGYMHYEKKVLTEIIALRSSAQSAQSVAVKALKEGQLTQGLHRLFAVAENYPELKAQASFNQLQGRISDLENQIADRREFYNESVNNYNIRIQSLPDKIIADWMALVAQEMFKISDDDRRDVSIDIKTP